MNDFREEIAFAEMNPHTCAIDLHGMHRDEAEYAVDAFLHREFMAGERVVKVICGKGTGSLSAHIRAFLREHPLVKGVEMSLASHEIGAVVYVVLGR